jgi:hypothetical protein
LVNESNKEVEMNTIVFVLMTLAGHENWVPAMEFTTQAKCEAAAISLRKQAAKHVRLGTMARPWCAKIEK